MGGVRSTVCCSGLVNTRPHLRYGSGACVVLHASRCHSCSYVLLGHCGGVCRRCSAAGWPQQRQGRRKRLVVCERRVAVFCGDELGRLRLFVVLCS
jgi:hypothetical protein